MPIAPAGKPFPASNRGPAVALAAMLVLGGAGFSHAGMAPPDELVPQRAIEALTGDLTAGRIAAAVERVELILAEGSIRFAKSDVRVLPVAGWVDELLATTGHREKFVEQYEKVAGVAAQRALADGVRSENVTAIVGVRTRYPWALAAGNATAEAAKLLARYGDVRGAKSLLGRIPASTLDAAGRQILELPDDAALTPAAFSGNWFETPQPVLPLRLVPVGSKDVVFVASSLSVSAMSAQGRTLWTTGEPPDLKPLIAATDRRPGANVIDQSIGQPAVWADLSGTPRIVVARYTTESISSLRAYKAASGEPLWDTADNAATRGLRAIGNPVIAGAYTYQAMIDFEAASSRMLLVALDTVSGQELWRTHIGDAPSEPSKTRPREDLQVFRTAPTGLPALIDQILFSSAQLAADDGSIYAATGGGWCVRVDRFSGAVQWYAPYTVVDSKVREQERRKKNAPLFRRWRDRPVSDGSTVVIAPTDSDLLIAFDAATGKAKWKQETHRGDDLVGILGDQVILAGASVTALKTDSGETAWQNAASGAKLTGPAFIDGDAVGIMTERGPVYFSGEQGQVTPRKDATAFNFDQILRQPMTRAQLQTAKLLTGFKTDGVPEKPTPTPPRRPTPKPEPAKK